MAVHKPKEFKKIPMKKLTQDHLKELIASALVRPTSEIVDILAASEEEIELSIIEMAVFRCAWIGYMDGDVKRLEWLLNKVGIKESSEDSDSVIDFSKISSDAILKALNVREDSNGKDGKKEK